MEQQNSQRRITGFLRGAAVAVTPVALIAVAVIAALVTFLPPRPTQAGQGCKLTAPAGRETVSKFRGSKLELFAEPRKNAASEVVKKAVAQHCLPLVVLDQSDNGFLLVTYDGQEKWVEAHKVKVGDKQVKIKCLQVSQSTGSSRGAGESPCQK